MNRQVRRYFAGRAPAHCDGSSDESSDSDDGKRVHHGVSKNETDKCTLNASFTLDLPCAETKIVPVSERAPRLVTKRSNRRPRIEAKVVVESDVATKHIGEPKVRRRQRIEPKIIGQELHPTHEANDGGKRKGMRGFAPVTQDGESSEEEEQSKTLAPNAERDSSGGSSSGYDSSSGSELNSESADDADTSPPQPPTPPPHAPVFVPRSQRSGTNQGVSEAQIRREQEKKNRDCEAREKALQAARAVRDEAEFDLRHVDMSTFPDDTDRIEEYEEEFAMWRVRELKRVMRDRGMGLDEQ